MPVKIAENNKVISMISESDVENNSNSIGHTTVSLPNKSILQSPTEERKGTEVSLANETPGKSQSGSLDAIKTFDDNIAGLSIATASSQPQCKVDNSNSKNEVESADLNSLRKQPDNLTDNKSDEPLQSSADESGAQTEAKTAAGSRENPPEEDAAISSETGEEDQVIQEFLHVSAKVASPV